MHVELVWATPNLKETIIKIARVSNPNNQGNDERLLNYLIQHSHWSPFEMASVCLSIKTTRDIGRQILRHRSFHFQEFSQRYAEVIDVPELFKARRQDTKNRQNSIDDMSQDTQTDAYEIQENVYKLTNISYKNLLDMGVAKEQARKILPEGITPTHMYMVGTVRDWYHYCRLRTGNGTQLEHQEVALDCQKILNGLLPEVFKA